MFEYMNILNTTTGLDKQLEVAMRTPEIVAGWTEEEVVVADILKKDFAKSAIDLPRTQRENKLKGMDPTLVRDYTTWGQTRLPTTGGVAAAAIRTVQNEEVRKEIFMATRTASSNTVHKLEELLCKRAELAKLSRYESYSHLALGDKMAKSPASVSQFLQALAKDNNQIVKGEVSELLTAKLSNSNASSTGLQPWDKDYYMTQILGSIRSHSRNSDFLSAYFSLGTVMQGLSRLFTRLYGVRLAPHETMPGETWNSDVRRLDVISETDGHVATDEEAANDGMATSRASGVLKQLPTIALICDFVTMSGKSSRPALLSFNENVSGTRCATDFAELPSVLMEHFAADPSVLSLFARHYETDQALPYEMVAEKLALDKRFEGSDTENQIILSMLDLAYHSDLPLSPTFNSTEIYHSLQREHGALPIDPPGTCWQGFFGHLFGYGSTYYSYLFDKVLARRIWQVVFRGGEGGGGVHRDNGEKMKEEVLKWGGGRDPWKCLAGVLDDGRVENGDQKAMAIVGSWGAKR
ncbi:hypothetical protein EYC84_003888 [Monilinia fructicola]|uniref:Mitochondrial intermediate peptidase n=1 Tax=Monilinia fructicola TaxID=38448 RepID=A0A5M9JYM5_MONFR|nr:hypothetical protein EYC84_003888 [Monilinia fructicola]